MSKVQRPTSNVSGLRTSDLGHRTSDRGRKMDKEKIMVMVKRDMRHAAEMLIQASEDCDGMDEMNICIQSVRQILNHDAALIGQAMGRGNPA